MNMFKKVLGIGAALLLFSPVTSQLSFAACVMCNSDGGCDIVDGDAFVNCRVNYGCSGNCRNRPPCPELPCNAPVDEVALGDGQKSGSACGMVEGITLKSMQTAAQIFNLTGNDDLAAMAILKLESNARDGYLADGGAFAFALPRNESERSKVIEGNALQFTPFGVDATGFADYAMGLGPDDGLLDVTIRAWRVSAVTGQPVFGLTTKLKYRVVDGALALVTQQVIRDMPLPRPGYFNKKQSNSSTNTTANRLSQTFQN